MVHAMLIASRLLTLDVNGKTQRTEIRIFAPERGQHGDWSCRYEVDWPDGTYRKDIWGLDPVQALVLALQEIGDDIYCSEYHRAGTIRWEKAGDGYGFPVSSTTRDLMVGADRRFYA